MSRYASRSDHEELIKRYGTPPRKQFRILTLRDVFSTNGMYRLKRRNKHCIDVRNTASGIVFARSRDARFRERFNVQAPVRNQFWMPFTDEVKFIPADIPMLVMYIHATGGVLKTSRIE